MNLSRQSEEFNEQFLEGEKADDSSDNALSERRLAGITTCACNYCSVSM